MYPINLTITDNLPDINTEIVILKLHLNFINAVTILSKLASFVIGRLLETITNLWRREYKT